MSEGVKQKEKIVLKQREEKVAYDEEEERVGRREIEEGRREEKKKKAELGPGPGAREKPEARRKEVVLPGEVGVPVVELGKLVELREVRVDKEVPEAREEEAGVPVLVVELAKPSIELRQAELDHTLPSIAPEERGLEVPLVELRKPVNVVCSITTFDEKPPLVNPVERPLIILTYIAPRPLVLREAISSFDASISPELLRGLATKKGREEAVTGEEVVERAPAVGEPSGGGEEFEEAPDVMDLVFGVPGGEVSLGRPRLVLYKELEDDRTIGSFETLCIRVYREIEGGEPVLKPIEKLDETDKKEIEKWLDPSGKLIVVDLDKAAAWAKKGKEEVKRWFSRENLGGVLKKTRVGAPGFLIFKTRDNDLYNHCLGVVEELLKEYRDLDVLYVKPRKLEKEAKEKLASLMWGNLRLEEGEFPGAVDFDDIFDILKGRFERRLKSFEKEEGGLYVHATNQHEGEESYEHFMMKCFIVKLLSKERGLRGLDEIKEVIKTEEEKDGVVPDILVGDSVYEVETLFAEDREGRIPMKKIGHSITKYEGTSIKEVNVVLDNLTFLRHLGDLVNTKRVLDEWARRRGKAIRFYTIDMQNNKLLPLEEVLKEVRGLRKPVPPGS